MRAYIFKRENNNFDDIKKDHVIKRKFKTFIAWSQHLMIGTEDLDDKTDSYILLKFGEELVTSGLFKDFTPVPYVDYTPDPNRPEKFKNVYK